jgi:hypothetical protein
MKTKIALAAALVVGFASAATAQDEAPDFVRGGGNAYAYESTQLIEGRNVYIPQWQAPARSVEEMWFERASNSPAG